MSGWTSTGRTALAAACCLAVLGGVFGCRPPGDAARVDDAEVERGHETFTGAAPGGMAVVLEEGEPDELNPLTYESSPAHQVVRLVFRALARRDTTLADYDPDLLESWEREDDRTVVLRVRENLRWHDGQPVTAHDVAFTIERQGDPQVASPRQADVAAVENVEVVDDHTLRVRLTHAGRYNVNALLEVVPVPRHLLEGVSPAEMRMSTFGRQPVGNGLFRFDRWQRAQQIVLVANDQVPEGRPPLDRIVIRIVPDASARLTELLAGNADMTRIAADQRERVQGASGVALERGAMVRPAWIAWNVDREPVDDVRVRRAVLMAIDRQQLVGGLLGEMGEPATSPIPSALWEKSDDVTPIPHDPAGAARLLDEAGWLDDAGDGIRRRGGQPLRLEVEYSAADPVRADMLVAMQSQLRRVGIDLVPRAFERTTWVDRLRNRQFQGSFWGWGWGPGVAGPNAAMVFHSRSIPPGGPNFAGYSNPQADALIDRILVETDEGRLRSLWRELEQVLIDDAVYSPIFLDPEAFAVNARFADARFHGPEWWESVIYWSVPPNRRLPRDRAGAQQGAAPAAPAEPAGEPAGGQN